MTLRARLLLLAAIILVPLAIFGWVVTRPNVSEVPLAAVQGVRPRITEPRIEHFPSIGIAKAVGWPAGGAPTPAPGLGVTRFAAGLAHPRWLYELPNGDVLVAETNAPSRDEGGITGWVMNFLFKEAGADAPSANRITLLRDTGGTGIADLKTTFMTGLNSPFGMALVGDRLYIADTDAIVSVPYTSGQTRITARPTRLIGLPPGGRHWTKSLVASPDGKFLYVGVGSDSNIGERGLAREQNRAAVWEVPIDGRSWRLFTTGARNPVGLAWEPRGQRLWMAVNERDMLGPDVPPDYLARVDFGAFYGWPYSYWGGYEDPRIEEKRPDLLQYTKRPEYALGPHTASLGLAFGSLGPFRDGAFIGQHGSWNRVPAAGYKVAFVPFDARGFPAGAMRDVLTGFLDAKGRAQGRPVGVLVDRRGGLLVADDVGNAVWRVAAR